MRRTALLMLLAAAVFPGCDRTSRWGASWPSEAERTMSAEHAPTPFTAAQIRAGCPDGRRSTYVVTNPGEKPHLRVFTFRDGDAEGTRFGLQATTIQGVPLGPLRESRATWPELQSHASWPAGSVTVARETLHLAPGWFHCMRYAVRTPEAPPGSSTVLWFARELPGPPVRMERYEGGELRERMTLFGHGISHESRP